MLKPDNRIAYVAQPRLDLSYPNDMLIDVIHYELSASNVQSAHGILVVNVFHHNRSYVDLETLVSTSENVLQKINAGLSKQVLLIIATILICLLLVITLVLIMRLCPFRREQSTGGMPEQSSTKSLSGASDNLERCGRQYSSTSLRQTDCSSRTSSSNSALAVMATSASTGQLNNLSSSSSHHNEMAMRYADLLPPSQFAYKQQPSYHNPGSHRPLLAMESLDAFLSPTSSDLQQKQLRTSMRPSLGPQSDKSEDISPLPPPSLYFINDSSFDDHAQMWSTKGVLKFEMQAVESHARDQQANRSSGDGTSHSESPHHSVATMKAAITGKSGKPYEQFVHLDNYLAREQAFYTLNSNKRTSKTSKSPHTQKSQYWI